MQEKNLKRLAATAVTLVMLVFLVSAGAEGIGGWFQSAEPTATPAPNAFRFRDGIRWGMNTQQVRALETSPMIERSMQSWSIMKSDGKVVVSRFTADLVFMFREDRLMMISYEFPQGNPDSFLYLSGALSSLYGEKTDADPMKIKALMDGINPNLYKAELITQACVWNNADGTSVYLYYFSQTDFAILYVSPELGTRIYQVNGL